MTNDELEKALENPDKASRKALAKLAADMEADEPERYAEILAKTDWEGEALRAYRGYKTALILSRVAMILAVIAVFGGFLAGDFGLQLLTGWLNRYALAGGVLVGMGIFAGGVLLLNSKKERLIAYGILEGM